MSKSSFDKVTRQGEISENSSILLQRAKGEGIHSEDTASPERILGDLERATGESSQPLDPDLSASLNEQFGYDFSRVRIHSGPSSSLAAKSLGARAYTLGNRVHLGDEADSLGLQERNRLLVHEAVHTVQQGGRDVAPSSNLNVSTSQDAAEMEAEQLADTFSDRSPSLRLRDQLRSTMPGQRIARSVSPHIQRDLKGKRKAKEGDFNLNLTTQSHPGAKSGMFGTIKFRADEKAPDSNSIRLLQIVRLEDLSTGKEYVWGGDDAYRNKIMTSAAKDVDPGFHVDIFRPKISPRTKKTDDPVSPYYADYMKKVASNKHGSKKGKTIREASLRDYPGWSSKCRYSFETAAKAKDTGHVYATLTWGFTLSDPAKGKVEKEHADAHDTPSKTFGAAVKKFDEVYRNPGASTAP